MLKPRIASLVPSLTELAVALGLRPWLVARTGFCVHPADALAEVPKVGGTKDVQINRLLALAPTHVLLNVDENRLETVEALRPYVPHLVVTHPQCPADNLVLLAQFSEVFAGLPGVSERAQALAEAMRRGLADTRPEAWAPQSVWVPIWREPWMTVARDTYISRTLALLNWHTWPPVLGGECGAARYPRLTGSEPWLTDVERVLLPSEPYRFGPRHVDEVRTLCPHAQVDLVDGEWLSWYGPRAPQAWRALRALRDQA